MAAISILLIVTGCTRIVTGQARDGEPVPGVDALFQGDLPDYGQTLDDEAKAELTYMRAMRRVDPCGFAESLKEIGEVGAYFGNLEGCTVPVKASGTEETWVDMNLVLDDTTYLTPAFNVGSVPVYGTTDTCTFRMVLPLPRHDVSGSTDKKPMLKVSDYAIGGEEEGEPLNCELMKAASTTLAKSLTSNLQVRHALSAYPIKLAERDPCEVLKEYPGQVRDVEADSLGGPFGCDFRMENLDYSVELMATAKNYWDYDEEERDGVTYYYFDDSPEDLLNCHAVALVGDAMYGKDPSTGSIHGEDGSDPYYPAISVSTYPEDETDCGKLREVMDRAVRLFANSGR